MVVHAVALTVEREALALVDLVVEHVEQVFYGRTKREHTKQK